MCQCNDCNNTYQIIWVDVNGYKKKPNIVGKDVFGVKVEETGIKPLGFPGDVYENTCNTTSGFFLGGVVQQKLYLNKSSKKQLKRWKTLCFPSFFNCTYTSSTIC